jgi:long-chain acyl-CoA synthetase
VPSLLTQAAAKYGNRPAVDFMGKRTNYAELEDQVSRAAEALREWGVAKGTHVALAMPNCPQHVVAFYAVLRLGAVVVECNPTYTVPQFRHQLSDAQVSHAIVWNKVVAEVIEAGGETLKVMSVDMTRALPAGKRFALRMPVRAARELRAEMTARTEKHIPSFDFAIEKSLPLDPQVEGPQVDDLALLQYTGGTTGVPKGAMLTHSNLLANTAQSLAWIPTLQYGNEVFYGMLPFFHAFGMQLCLLVPAACGGELVVFPKFSPTMVAAAQKRIPGTFFPGVPPMLERVLHACQETDIPLTSFRHAICGAMAMDPNLAESWESASGGILMEGYGMSEASPIALGNPAGPGRRPGTLGLPFPSTDIRIVDPETGEDVEKGQSGELLVRGPQVFQGYWNDADESTIALRDGWLHTGDEVVEEPDGLIRLVDRIKEVIITGGFNVYPSQVEKELMMMPEIEDIAVVGIPYGDIGERVVAAVVLAKDAELSLEQVREWGAERLSHYSLPKQLEIMKTLPRSQIGKTLRRMVQKEITDRDNHES